LTAIQPNNDKFICVANKLLTIPNVLCESMIYTHSTKPMTNTYALCESLLRLNKAAQKYHNQQEGSSRGRSQWIVNCSPLTNPLAVVGSSRFIK
jgi:hypothetical protein